MWMQRPLRVSAIDAEAAEPPSSMPWAPVQSRVLQAWACAVLGSQALIRKLESVSPHARALGACADAERRFWGVLTTFKGIGVDAQGSEACAVAGMRWPGACAAAAGSSSTRTAERTSGSTSRPARGRSTSSRAPWPPSSTLVRSVIILFNGEKKRSMFNRQERHLLRRVS